MTDAAVAAPPLPHSPELFTYRAFVVPAHQ